VIMWTRANDAPMISSLESHRQWELPRGGVPVLCCVDGSPGQRKVDFTLLPNRVCVEVDNTLAVPFDLFRECQQVIFRKRTDDLLANPKADRFLTHLACEEFVVFGNGLESAVKAVTLGLLTRNKRVTVVLDACGYWDIASADLAVRQVAAKGASVVTISELMARSLTKRLRCGSAEPHGNNGSNGKNGGNGKVPHGTAGQPRSSDRNGEELKGLLDPEHSPRMAE